MVTYTVNADGAAPTAAGCSLLSTAIRFRGHEQIISQVRTRGLSTAPLITTLTIVHRQYVELFLTAQQPQWARDSSLSRLRDHTRQDPSGRVISPTQRPLPDNTQHSKETDIHAPGGFRTRNPSKQAVAECHISYTAFWHTEIKQCERYKRTGTNSFTPFGTVRLSLRRSSRKSRCL
jgi:hypothetical protein